MKGIIKSMRNTYGFIQNLDEIQKPECFFHISIIDNKTISIGDKVEYEAQQTSKGWNATSLEIIRD